MRVAGARPTARIKDGRETISHHCTSARIHQSSPGPGGTTDAELNFKAGEQT
jgi:hypothetical protein